MTLEQAIEILKCNSYEVVSISYGEYEVTRSDKNTQYFSEEELINYVTGYII